jgi:hypothetical protein
MQRKITYSLAKLQDCYDHENRKIANFTIRTTDGTDEAYASRRADSKGSAMTEELIRFSLVSYSVIEDDAGKLTEVAVNGETVASKSKTITIVHPFEGFDKWSTKARNYVVAAWKKLATPDEADLADFFASATEAE